MTSAQTEPGSITLAVQGMSCGGCARAVGNALRETPGVEEVSVDLGGGRAVVRGNNLSAPDLIKAVREAGYDAKVSGEQG